MGGAFAVKAFAKNKQDLHIRLKMDNRTAICYINRMGGTRSHTFSHSLPAMAMVPSKGYYTFCRIPTRREQCHSRSGIPNSTILSRVDVENGSIQQVFGQCSVDLFASRLNNQFGRYISWRPDPFAIMADAFQMSWKNEQGYAFPPFALLGKCLQKIHQEGCTVTLIAPTWSTQPLYPTLLELLTIDLTEVRVSSDRPIQSNTSTTEKGSTGASRLEGLRRLHLKEGVSKMASDLMLAGWSKGTNSTYQSSWSKWNSWCITRELNPFSTDVRFFLDFLAELFEQGLQYRSINTVRSAVSMTHTKVEGVPIGQHPLVSRLLKGIHNTRPPQPRYHSTWDVEMVTEFISFLGANEQLSIKHLSRKLALLMALVEVSRTSELQALDLRFRVYKPEGILFKLPSLTKKRNPGLPPKELFFGAFPANTHLCVVKCLQQYETVTEQYRPKEQEPNPLFLSYIRPYKPITSQRIAHWIKNLLEEAGVDTSVFKAHSVRGASATVALNKGVSLSDILNTADWSKDSTFRRFYYRPTESNNYMYAQKVLQANHK